MTGNHRCWGCCGNLSNDLAALVGDVDVIRCSTRADDRPENGVNRTLDSLSLSHVTLHPHQPTTGTDAMKTLPYDLTDYAFILAVVALLWVIL